MPKSKPESTVAGGSQASPQSKSTSSANGSKLHRKETQQKREHAKLKPFKEGRSSGPPPAADWEQTGGSLRLRFGEHFR